MTMDLGVLLIFGAGVLAGLLLAFIWTVWLISSMDEATVLAEMRRNGWE